ncbi:HalOD1 output domain-containing protein [Halovivax cerinus]|uniref:HalOD1 output domain-containing protein n=1 Tax=Halovivax cerinus TaxID=1487865 RepID=A0ABD5NJA0_9EURY|nr:HalOD1 output domain-containing protein [Halovivax cerinus]
MTEANATDCGPDLGMRRGWVEYSRSTGEPASVAVVNALAQFEGTAPTAMETPLYEYIDPEALDALFASRPDETARAQGEVRFVTDTATVVVGNETVRVFERVTR